MALDKDTGKVGKRNDEAFETLITEIDNKIGGLPVDYSDRAGQLPRVNPTGTKLEFVGPYDFGEDAVAGGRFTHLPVSAGDAVIAANLSGFVLESHNGADVTWTFKATAKVGTVLEILQIGDGAVIPEVEPGAELKRVDLATRTAGPDSTATMRVIRLNDGGKAVWKFYGETVA